MLEELIKRFPVLKNEFLKLDPSIVNEYIPERHDHLDRETLLCTAFAWAKSPQHNWFWRKIAIDKIISIKQ